VKLKRNISATIQLYVFKVVFAWGWRGGERQYIECFIPPIMLSSVSADKLYDASRTHPFTRMVNWFKLLLARITLELAFQMATHDRASGNLKSLAYEVPVILIRVLLSCSETISPIVFLDMIDIKNHQEPKILQRHEMLHIFFYKSALLSNCLRFLYDRQFCF
jgi:hypothetical protein